MTLDILVVDDERTVREGLVAAIEQAGFSVIALEGIEAARAHLSSQPCRCILLDIKLRDGDGLAFLDELRATRPSIPVIMATAYGDSARTIAAMKSGAFDYVTKPFDLDSLIATLRRATKSQATSSPPPRGPEVSEGVLLGQSAKMLDVWKAVGRASASDAPVLITGETGVGKELVARAIHDNGARARGPFVAVNVAALPPTLLESELFGHEKGAFTGAMARRVGRFEAAAHGTLFLDEVGDLDLALQTKLLRVLQDGSFERVGSQEASRTDARIIAATSKPVEPTSPDTTLRPDLYYRLGVVAIHVPPLRERPSDIPVLVRHFLERASKERRAVSEEGLARLAAYRWPGNVRELQHAVERACVMSTAEVLDADDFEVAAQATRTGDDDLDLKRATERLEADLIVRAIARAGGNRAEAARLLGIARPQLYAKIRDLGLRIGDRKKV